MTTHQFQIPRLTLLIPALGICVFSILSPEQVRAQGAVNWLSSGSLQNWFSEKGWEIEEGNVRQQQYGLRWPAQYDRQDNQAAKGFWIGAKNFTDEKGIFFTEKVVHVGPRVAGDGEFFPVKFELYAKVDPPSVLVDGIPSSRALEDLKGIDPTQKADRVLVNVVNTAIGITVTRKIHQFSQQHHDNYHVFEMTFKNTGFIDGTNVQKLNQTVTGVYFYWQYRYSVSQEVRYIVNNSAGWGINTMNDARGFSPDATNSPFDIKCQFSWHGFHNAANKPTAGTFPNAATFDNIGGPIWNPSQSNGYVSASDTTWRLGGAQFVGNAHIYAPTSATDTTRTSTQPSTTNYVASDDPVLTQRNSQFNTAQMTAEYTKMSEGHTARHAWLVDPTGNFRQQTVMANISSPVMGDGSPGGFSSATGYGPYTLAPGQSVTVVFVEGVDGLTREESVRIGRLYKNGAITTLSKNDSVFLGRDRLFNTFRRAVANYNSGYNIPQPPEPPSTFTVQSSGNKIGLSWTPGPNQSANGFAGYRLYRATARNDSTYYKIYEGNANSYADTGLTRGVDYYYYVTAFGNASANNGVGLTPAGSLESSRFYTQTYVAANLKRPPGASISDIRIVPNPYNITANASDLLFPNTTDRIAFFNIPGNCVIKIFTELGELIKEIVHDNGTGDEYWNSTTSSNQIIASGIYIVVFQDKDTGQQTIKKLVVIR
ncbi:MAG: Fibronectin type III domain protein [Bacteroidetes bacterium]|nr:Fibronectin type III domain protein [Bacteroidota bacterium]